MGNEAQTCTGSIKAVLRVSSTRHQAETSVAITDIGNSSGHLELTLVMLTIDAPYIVTANPRIGPQSNGPDIYITKI